MAKVKEQYRERGMKAVAAKEAKKQGLKCSTTPTPTDRDGLESFLLGCLLTVQ